MVLHQYSDNIMLIKSKLGRRGIKNKAFTLVELLGVIIILGMLALIIYPILTKTIKNQEKKTFEQSMEGIIKTVQNDMATDDSKTPRYYYYDNGKLTLLSVNGEDRNEIIKTNGKTKATGYILVDIHGNIILDYLCDKKYCGYNTEDNSKVVIIANNNNHSNIDKNAPILTLNGKGKIILNFNERYIEQGVTAKTKVGEDLSSNVETKIEKDGEEVSKIDTSIVGIYTITYSLTYQEETLTVERIVEVKDEKPTIIITEASPKYVKEQTVKIEVQASGDNKVNNFIYQINGGVEKTVTGTSTTIQLKETGEYQFTVEVTDSKGNKSTKQSEIYKIDTIAPTITIGEIPKIKVTEVGGYNPLEGVEITDNMKVVETTIEGSFTATVGTQTVTIVVKDEAGNTTRKERTIEVITAEGPILNLSTVRTSNWVKSLTVTATASSTENIQTFTYEVIKDGVSEGIQNGTISGNSGTIEIPLTTSGIYQIKLIGTDIYGSSSSLISGEYQIDATAPVLSDITNSSNGNWVTSLTVSWDITENESGIKNVQYSFNQKTWSNFGTSDWYGFTRTNQRNDVVYVRVVDNAGNISNIKSMVMKIDRTAPATSTIAVKSKGGNTSGATVDLTIGGTDALSGIDKYIVYYGASASSLTSSKTITTTATSTSVTITGLPSGINRYFKVVAYDKAGNTKESSVISTQTYFKTYYATNQPEASSVVYNTNGIVLTNPLITSVGETTYSWAGIKCDSKALSVGDVITITFTSSNSGAYLETRLYMGGSNTNNEGNILNRQNVTKGTNTVTYTYTTNDTPEKGFIFEIATRYVTYEQYAGSITITSIKVNDTTIYPAN